MAKRIYWESIKKWAITAGIPVGIAGFALLFYYLVFLQSIIVTGISDDMKCAGTIKDPCLAYINFTAKEDIFLYPIGYDPWGRDTPFYTDKGLKSWKMYRSWGTSWREIDLSKTCTATWCGAPPDSPDNKYSFAFRDGRDYEIKIVALKENPDETIKWGFGPVDPFWYGINDTADILATTINLELGSKINISANISGVSTVCVDIDHPEYGDNYTCGSPNAIFDFNISYFRKTEMNDSTTEKSFPFIQETYIERAEADVWKEAQPYTNIFDDDWNTYAEPNMVGSYYVNYTIPPGGSNETKWEIKDSNGSASLSIPSMCWNVSSSNKVQLYLTALDPFLGTHSIEYYCKNSTEWNQLAYRLWPSTVPRVYEESFNWEEDWPVTSETFYIRAHKYDEVINFSINVTGSFANESYPTEVTIEINGTQSNYLGILFNDTLTYNKIKDSEDEVIRERYLPINSSFVGDCYSWASCYKGIDEDWGSYALPDGEVNFTFNYTVPSDVDSVEIAYLGGGGYFYCYNDGSASFEYIGYYAYPTQSVEVKPSCYDSEDALRIRVKTYHSFYETAIDWISDEISNTFLFDESGIKTGTFNLPKESTVNSAELNLTGSYSESVVDQLMTSDFSYGFALQPTNYYSQSFKPKYSNLTHVGVYLSTVGSPTGDITINLGTTQGASDLSSQTISATDSFSSGTWVKLDVTDQALTPETTYYLTLEAPYAAGNYVSWVSGKYNSNYYARGTAISEGIGNLSTDFAFKTYIKDSPSNLSLEVGSIDGIDEWNYTGDFVISNRTQNFNNSINTFLDTCSADSDGYCLVPVYIFSISAGKVKIHEIDINYSYNPNPVILNSDLVNSFLGNSSLGFVDIPIKITNTANGIINISDIRFDYAGGNDTIEIFVFEGNLKLIAFNNSIESQNLTFSGDENITRYLEIPRYGDVNLAYFNLSSYGNGSDYVSNLSILINDTEIWNYDGEFGGTETLSDSIKEYYDAGDDEYGTLRDVRYSVQTFTIGTVGMDSDFLLTNVSLKINVSVNPGNITLNIRNVNATGYPIGGNLSTGWLAGSSITTGSAEWYNFTMPDSLILNASTQYAIELRASEGNTTAYLAWGRDGTSATYTGGQFIYTTNGGSSWIPLSTKDSMFRVYGGENILRTNISQTDEFSNILNIALNDGACDCVGCSIYGDNCTLNFTFHSDTAGTLGYSAIDISYDNKGNNDTLNLINYYSNWNYAFPEHIDWMEFIPQTPTSDNVTPYGQTDSRPILNITTYNYGGKNMNLSIYLNESYPCVNLSWNTNSNKKVFEGGYSDYVQFYDDFENDFGHWDENVGVNCPDDDAWGKRDFKTPTSNTGPQNGGVGGAGTYFMYVETSSGSCYDVGDVALVYFNTTINYDLYYDEEIKFYFDAYGTAIDDLYLQENSTGSWITLWEMHDINNDYWNLTSIDLSDLTGNGTLRFNYTRTTSIITSDIALDRINVSYATNNQPGINILNNSWQKFATNLNYLGNSQLWFWADYNCNYTTWKLWEPELSFRGCCVDCICSEEI